MRMPDKGQIKIVVTTHKTDHMAPYLRQKRERIFAELRRGHQIIIRDQKGQAAIIRAAEFADFGRIVPQEAIYSGELLCLTPQHLASWDRSFASHIACFSTPVSMLSEQDILSVIIDQNDTGQQIEHLLAEKKDSLPDLACRILRASKLLPAALMARCASSEPAFINRLSQSYELAVIDYYEIEELTKVREPRLMISSRAHLPLSMAEEADIVMFREDGGTEEHFAVIVGSPANIAEHDIPLVRLHSQCVTGDVLGSLKCDCGQQLQHSLHLMKQAGYGILLYLEQEGRGIGLLNKIRAYALQDKGFDTVDANHRLGFSTDERIFAPAAAMLKALNCQKINLLTNNPDKISQLASFNIDIVSRVPLAISPNSHNKAYLDTKRDRTGHLLEDEAE